MLQLVFLYLAQFETRKAGRVKQAELAGVKQFRVTRRILSAQGLAADLAGLHRLSFQQDVGDTGFSHAGRACQRRLRPFQEAAQIFFCPLPSSC